MIRMISDEMTEVLTKFLNEYQKPIGRIVEIGTGYGHSAELFGNLKPKWAIYTIDAFGLYGDGRVYKQWPHEEVKAINQSLPENVIQVLGDSSKIKWELSIDILFLDGSHTYEGVSADFQRYAPHVKKNGLIIIDDYLQPGNETNGVKRFVDSLENEILYKSDRFVILKK